MENYSFSSRVKLSIKKGIEVSVGAAVVLSLGYISLILILLTLGSFSPTPYPVHPSQVSLSGGLVFLGLMMFILGVIPSVIVGILGGAIFGFVMALFNRLTNIVAAIIGLLLGAMLILAANYIFWRIVFFDPHSGGVTFIEYLLPLKVDSFSTYALLQNWYFFPNIIAFFASPCIGWIINTETSKHSNPQLGIY